MRYIVLFEGFNLDSLQKQLQETITNFRQKYRGGRKFFDEVDGYIKNPKNENLILEIVRNLQDQNLATSGEFGDILYKFWKEGKFECKEIIVFNGKIQTNKSEVHSWYPLNSDINDKDFIYVDDSYYSGRTLNKIKDFLKKYNSNIKETRVIYDGSEIKSDNINSLIRYYDLNLPRWNSNL